MPNLPPPNDEGLEGTLALVLSSGVEEAARALTEG